MSSGEHQEFFGTPDLVHAYLYDQHLEEVVGAHPLVSAQQGGLANFVYRIDTDTGTSYLKQRASFMKSRPEIPRAPDEIRDEIRAYEILGEVLPDDGIPQLLHVDSERHLFIVSEAQHNGAMLNDELAAGRYPIHSAASLARLIARLHGSTLDTQVTIRDAEREQMFYERQYQWLVRELPYPDDLSRDAAVSTVDRLAESPKALIWGDLSPKNVVTGRRSVALVDLETVHRGDPAFDLGYLLGHVLLEGAKADRLYDAVEMVHVIQTEYADALDEHANAPFVEQLGKDAIVFSGTSMLHRTLAALMPESRTQRPEVTERILNLAKYLINQESYDGIAINN